MRNCTTLLPLLISLFFNVKCSPISQPDYENAQYVSAQNVPTLAYKPQQIQYKQAGMWMIPRGVTRDLREIFAAPRAEGLQYYASQQQQQQKSPQAIQTAGYAPVRQVFVPTSQGPRQIDPNLYDQALKAAQQQATLRAPASQNQQQQQIVYQPQQVKYVPQPQQVKYVAQPQQVKYVAQPQYSAKYQQAQPQRPQKQGEEEEEEEGDYDPNPSYQFGFDVKDDQYTNYQTRKEERDGKTITGSYSVVDADGYIRTVKYTADPKEGFKAEVSREPTDIKIKIPKPHPQYQSLPRSGQQQQPSRAHQPQYIQVGPQREAHRGQEEENVVYQYQ
ncbi:putative uncharacterized protein DDB_G0271606 isoform X2 [Euwallacea fornicatus]|uniref:putative uncharacterized protein DDB_G0271606 isoform X2 n=1 Tax=Euwallacea fornicatus TaxID=995702 RepID=UPI00338DE53B